MFCFSFQKKKQAAGDQDGGQVWWQENMSIGQLPLQSLDALYLLKGSEDFSLRVDSPVRMFEASLDTILRISGATKVTLLISVTMWPFDLRRACADSSDSESDTELKNDEGQKVTQTTQHDLMESSKPDTSGSGKESDSLSQFDFMSSTPNAEDAMLQERLCPFILVGSKDSVEGTKLVSGKDHVICASTGGNFPRQVVGQAIKDEVPLIVNQIKEDHLTASDPYLASSGARSLIAFPVKIGGKVVSVVCLESTAREGAFARAESTLFMFGTMFGVTLHSAWLFHTQQRTHAMLEKALEARSAFLGNVSHELRTPLNGILATASELLQCLTPTEIPSKLPLLLDVLCSGESLLELLTNVSNYISLSTACVMRREYSIDIRLVIARALSGMDMWCDTSFVFGYCEAADTVPQWIRDDETLITYLIQFLAENAFKLSTAGQEVVVRVKRAKVSSGKSARRTKSRRSQVFRLRLEVEDW